MQDVQGHLITLENNPKVQLDTLKTIPKLFKTYQIQTLLGLGVFLYRTFVDIWDTDTYNYIKLCYFLKFFGVCWHISRVPCLVFVSVSVLHSLRHVQLHFLKYIYVYRLLLRETCTLKSQSQALLRGWFWNWMIMHHLGQMVVTLQEHHNSVLAD
jgi:hypothetical protein